VDRDGARDKLNWGLAGFYIISARACEPDLVLYNTVMFYIIPLSVTNEDKSTVAVFFIFYLPRPGRTPRTSALTFEPFEMRSLPRSGPHGSAHVLWGLSTVMKPNGG